MPVIELAPNLPMEYEERGEGQPVLFLHGSGVSWRFFEPQIPVFSPHYRMIMPNLRGHGRSGFLPRTDHYHELMADDLQLFLDKLGLKGIPVVGVSMGAVVALRLAIKYPAYVSKVVSVCGYSEMPTAGASLQLWLGNAIFSMLSLRTIMKTIDWGFKAMGANELTRRVIRDAIAIDKETYIKLKFIRFPNFTAELSRVTAPVLVMGGDGISYEAKGSRTIYEAVRDGRLAIFKGGFDPLSTERQTIHDEMILDFLAGRPIRSYPGVTYEAKRR
jgi:3-oxoadipate enol-lactonase